MALYIPQTEFSIWRGFCMSGRKLFDPTTYVYSNIVALSLNHSCNGKSSNAFILYFYRSARICQQVAMKRLILLLDKHQQHRHSIQSQHLEYISVCQEKQLRTGLSCSTLIDGHKYQTANMSSYSYL